MREASIQLLAESQLSGRIFRFAGSYAVFVHNDKDCITTRLNRKIEGLRIIGTVLSGKRLYSKMIERIFYHFFFPENRVRISQEKG